MSSITNALLRLHGLAALALAFGLPAAESSIFVGFIFPGETAAVLAGVLAYEHRVSLAGAIAAVCLGAIAGNCIGYWVGRRWGTRLLAGPLSRWVKPQHVARARATVERRGVWAVFLGRFTAGLRVPLPAVAGTVVMPFRGFVTATVAGGLLWGSGFVLLGYAAGASWRRDAETASTAGTIALIVVVAVVVAVLVLRWRRHQRLGVAHAQEVEGGGQDDGHEEAHHPEAGPR